jgi:hypothetical protein
MLVDVTQIATTVSRLIKKHLFARGRPYTCIVWQRARGMSKSLILWKTIFATATSWNVASYIGCCKHLSSYPSVIKYLFGRLHWLILHLRMVCGIVRGSSATVRLHQREYSVCPLLRVVFIFRCKIVKRILVIFSHVDTLLQKKKVWGTNNGVREKELPLARR